MAGTNPPDAGSTPDDAGPAGYATSGPLDADASPDLTPSWGSRIQITPARGAPHGIPTVRVGDPSAPVVGLPREVIQRIVRMNVGGFRPCYEAGLVRDPKLEGRVVVEFVIDPTGAVSRAVAAASTNLADVDVVRCVVRSFFTLAFPQPSGGSIIVQYPIQLSP